MRKSRAERDLEAARLVLEIATSASGEPDLARILATTLAHLRTVVPLTGGSIALVEGDDLVVKAAIGPFAADADGQRLRRGPSRSWRVVQRREPFLSGDLGADGMKSVSGPIRSWLAVPIVRRGEGIGLLEVDSTEPDAFDEADLELVERVVRALAGPLELAGRYAEERRANTMRDAFIGVISHELRTPITTIYGLSKILRHRHDTMSTEARADAIADIEAEADRLHRLTEDLLVLSRAEGGQVELIPEPILLSHIITAAVAAEQDRWPTRHFVVDVPVGLPPVAGEKTYAEQVVRNLLTNAAKYGPPGSTVTVRARADASEVTVTVLDEGLGVGDDPEQLFELFYRSPEASRSAAGAGIGLFVCRQLVGAMGGRIWAREREPVGSAFAFTLPIHHDEDGDEGPHRGDVT